MATMRAGLLKMGRSPLAAQVDAAIAAMATVGGSINKVAAAKRSLGDQAGGLQQAIGAIRLQDAVA